ADAETALFRIVQESLSNIHRHSGSPVASIRIGQKAGVFTLEVQDAGHGMTQDGAEATAAVRGVGITGMHERMKQLGGQLEVVSLPGGTTVRAILPNQKSSVA